MKTETKVLTTVLAITMMLLAGGIFFLSKTSPKLSSDKQGNTVYQIDYSKGHKIGSDSAKVRLVEFGDFECPACKAAQPAVKDIINSNKDNPNFQYIFRNYPLNQHLNARAGANAAESANAQNKYWEMHDKLYDTQEQWEALANPADFFAGLAKQLGLNDVAVKDAVLKNQYADIIQVDINDGNAAGLDATPTFYLNGRKLVISSFDDLRNAVKKALSAK